MALLGTRVETMQDGDSTVAVKTDVLVDPQSGLLVERKTVMAEVLSESGQHKALLVGQRTSVTAMPSARPQYRAIESRPPTQRYQPADNSRSKMHCMFCLLSVLFPPLICCWILYCCQDN